MVIDVCSRVWPGEYPWRAAGGRLRVRGMPARAGAGGSGKAPSIDATPEAHEAAAECVDASLVHGYRSERLGVRLDLGMIRAFADARSGRRLVVAGIDPLSPTLPEDLHEAEEKRAIGLALAPADQGCRPTHDRVQTVLEWCAAHRLPLFVNNPGLVCRASVLEYARPSLWDELAAEHRGVVMVFGDMGQVFWDEAVAMCAKHERVYTDLGSCAHSVSALHRVMLDAFERGVMDKLLFGSGFPITTPQAAIERIYGLNTMASSSLLSIPREALRGVVECDALSRLGVPGHVEVRPDASSAGFRRVAHREGAGASC